MGCTRGVGEKNQCAHAEREKTKTKEKEGLHRGRSEEAGCSLHTPIDRDNKDQYITNRQTSLHVSIQA